MFGDRLSSALISLIVMSCCKLGICEESITDELSLLESIFLFFQLGEISSLQKEALLRFLTATAATGEFYWCS